MKCPHSDSSWISIIETGAESLARLLQQNQSEDGLMEDSGMNLEADDSGMVEYKLPSFLPAEFRSESARSDERGPREDKQAPGVSRSFQAIPLRPHYAATPGDLEEGARQA